ncbi:E3 ubiquitin ligase involved in syntaxin degradation protein [Dioscorea alata]|uniref:E3 ubiquitin ligase involved in syntaxin degradation protein n=2 Tax=Dioscorea alata TaxID=55571 RepID=A0ACB7TUC8_DIOAL|nr:E3 ubiquitin ligase involved in syntaxin degradation protein [Dioscorea alata]KAH7651571.1 E3 ubiquitin ligase involved in syntaxin degradation protein [Dioscorea alata]
MKRLDKLQETLSSIFGAHSDHEKHEAIEDKEDVEKNFEKILKLINSGQYNNDSSDNDAGKSELVSLINDFHKRYQSLHGHYDHMIGKLKKHIRHKKGSNGSISLKFGSSDSDSSSSESEESVSRKEKSNRKHGEPEVSVGDYEALLRQFDTLKIRNDELENEAALMRVKLEEGESLAVQLAEKDKFLLEQENEIQTIRENVKVLQDENEGLKQELETVSKHDVEVDQKLKSIQNENEALISEKTVTLSRLHDEEKLIEQMKQEMSRLESENDCLKQDLEKAAQDVVSLNKQLNTVNEEIESLRGENSMNLSKIQELENRFSDAQAELKSTVENLSSQNANFLSENEELKNKMELTDQQAADLSQKLAISVEENAAVTSELLRISSKLEEVERNIKELTNDCELLKEENSKLQVINKSLDQQIRAKNEENSILTSEAQEKVELLMTEVEKLKSDKSQLFGDLENLKLELTATRLEASEAKKVIDITEDEKALLSSEKMTLLTKIQQLEKNLEDINDENEKLRADKSQLQIKINDLGLELEAARIQVDDMTKNLVASEEERTALKSEITMVMCKLEQSEVDGKQLQDKFEKLKEEESNMLQQNQIKIDLAENVLEKLKTEIEQLRADNSELHVKVKDLTLQLEVADRESTNLKELLGAVEEEKQSLASEIVVRKGKLEQVEYKVNEIGQELELVKEENGKLLYVQKDLQDQNHELEVKLEEVKKDASDRFLQMEQDFLLQKSTLEDELRAKISNQESMLNDQDDRFNKLLEDYKQLEIRFQESCTELHSAKEKIEEISLKEETIQLLETVDKEKQEKISQLHQSCKELTEQLKQSESEKADFDREITKLQGQIQTLEVQLRLVNQKLKVTETESKDKEEERKKIVEEIRVERRELEERVFALTKRSAIYENELKKMYEVARVGIAVLGDLLNKLESTFKENHRQLKMQLDECTEELHTAKTSVAAVVFERQELQVRVKYKDGIIALLKDEAGIAGAKMADLEKDKEELMRNAVKAEKKIVELEKKLKEKEESVLVVNEEKREAIRQLCILIEYHRENCNQLLKYISANHKNKR